MASAAAAVSPLFRTVENTFSRMGWQSRRVPGREVLEADFEIHHSHARVHAQVFAEINAVSVIAAAGHTIPVSRTGVVAEMLMRTNKELTIGNFELDYDEGRVLFRATNVFDNPSASPEIIASLVHAALAETDRITPFLTLVLRMSPDATTEGLSFCRPCLFAGPLVQFVGGIRSVHLSPPRCQGRRNRLFSSSTTEGLSFCRPACSVRRRHKVCPSVTAPPKPVSREGQQACLFAGPCRR
jgi:hypothetical protein